MWFRIGLILVLCTIGVVFSVTSDDLRVTLSNGSKLLGRCLRSFHGRPIKAFTSVPYAKPPVGDLRFKAPEPMEKWEGEYKAIHDGPICIQANPANGKVSGQEDCLYLNVYTPYMFEEKTSNLSVLFYVHGGGYIGGSGVLSAENPAYFLDHDVVLVTINYRLGVLGFMSTGEKNCPGNFAFKDVIMALQWVRQNIYHFGGNPNDVTIFGGSCGASLITHVTNSPLAKGLVSKAIASSGTDVASFGQPAHKGVAIKRVTYVAKSFNCYSRNDWSKTINCLREVSAENITASLFDSYEFNNDPIVTFSPVVEPDLPGAFMTTHPREGKNGNSYKIPFLTGVNYDEGLLRVGFFTSDYLMNDFIERIDTILPVALYYDHHDLSVQKSITKRIKDFYFGGNFTREKAMNITQVYSDGWFLSGLDDFLRLRFTHKDAAPTYVYLFAHESSVSFSTVFGGDPEVNYGVSHADEFLYLFPSREAISPTALPTRDDEKIREAIIRLWVDFAKTGNPTPSSSPLPQWHEVSEFPLKYYRIGKKSQFQGKPLIGMEEGGIFEERAQLWRELNAHAPANHTVRDEL